MEKRGAQHVEPFKTLNEHRKRFKKKRVTFSLPSYYISNLDGTIPTPPLAGTSYSEKPVAIATSLSASPHFLWVDRAF